MAYLFFLGSRAYWGTAFNMLLAPRLHPLSLLSITATKLVRFCSAVLIYWSTFCYNSLPYFPGFYSEHHHLDFKCVILISYLYHCILLSGCKHVQYNDFATLSFIFSSIKTEISIPHSLYEMRAQGITVVVCYVSKKSYTR